MPSRIRTLRSRRACVSAIPLRVQPLGGILGAWMMVRSRAARMMALLRDVPGGWLCAVCGYREDAPEVVMPEVEGPHLPGW